MSMTWGSRWSSFWRSRRNLQIGWLVAAGIAALYVGAVRQQDTLRGINDSKTTGLASVDNSKPSGLWQESKLAESMGGVPGGFAAMKVPRVATFIAAAPRSESTSGDSGNDRKMVRTGTLEMVVQRPAETADQIRRIAEREGGFLVSSEVRGDLDATGATLTIRVPVSKFGTVRDEIRKLGMRIEGERIEAQDVSRQYTDQEANLRNLKAEEQQYLLILKQARSVKDTLEVSEKLSDVRGQIEQEQAEFNTLSKQIETVSMTVSLRAEAEARVLGLNWRPLYEIKSGFRDGLDGLANYMAVMTAFIFFLPTIVLWLATFLLGGLVAWRLLRWTGRRWFGWKAAGQNPAPITTS